MYLFLLLSKPVPHGGNYFGYISKSGVGILSFNGRLGVSEEQGVGRHRFRGLIRILLLLLFLGFGFGLHHLWRRPLLTRDLEDRQWHTITAYWHRTWIYLFNFQQKQTLTRWMIAQHRVQVKHVNFIKSIIQFLCSIPSIWILQQCFTDSNTFTQMLVDSSFSPALLFSETASVSWI